MPENSASLSGTATPRTLMLERLRSVNRLGFGAMRLTGDQIWGEPARPNECLGVLRRAIEIGVNFIDTADSYGPEVSERLIAEALRPYAVDPTWHLISLHPTRGQRRRPVRSLRENAQHPRFAPANVRGSRSGGNWTAGGSGASHSGLPCAR